MAATRGDLIVMQLAKYHLDYLWLMKELEKWEEVCIDKSCISLYIRGIRHGKRAEEIVSASERVLKRYAERYGDVEPD